MVTLKCWTMESTTSLKRPKQNSTLAYTAQRHFLHRMTQVAHFLQSNLNQLQSFLLPVHAARTFIRLDVYLIQIDVYLGYFHLEAVGQKLDGLPNGAIARSPRQRKQGLGSNGSLNNTCQKNKQVTKKWLSLHFCSVSWFYICNFVCFTLIMFYSVILRSRQLFSTITL